MKVNQLRHFVTCECTKTVVNSGDNSSSRTSLICNSFLKETESMIKFFCHQQLTTRQKMKINKEIFLKPPRNLPPRQQKDLKRAGMCINIGDRPPYLNSILVTSSA